MDGTGQPRPERTPYGQQFAPGMKYNPAYPSNEVDKPIFELLRVADKAKQKAQKFRTDVLDQVNKAADVFNPLTQKALGKLDPLKHLTEHEIKKAEQLLRQRFGGFDDSLSAEQERRRKLSKYRQVFDALDSRAKGTVPINDLEDLFGAAELFEARTEVGALSYDADKDGNGSLDFSEFCEVLDKLADYHKQTYGRIGHLRGSFFFGTEGAALTMKQNAWRTIDDPTFSNFSRVVGFFLVFHVILAVSIFVMQSIPEIENFHHRLFNNLEFWCLTVFTGEFALRLLTCASKKKLIFSVANTVDVLTILPYYAEAVYDQYGKGQTGGALGVIRIFRIFRLYKVFKYVPYVSLMTTSAAASAAPICMAVFVLLIGMTLLAFAAYFTERGTWSTSAGMYVQSDGTTASPFQSIAEASYWAVITLSTVGYGDLVPASGAGKFVGALTALAGTVIVAFPVSIYTEEFSKEYNNKVKTEALQAELSQDDLCDRLLTAHKKLLLVAALPHFPATSSLSDALSRCVPRNLTMMRRARQMKVQEAAGVVSADAAAGSLTVALEGGGGRRGGLASARAAASATPKPSTDVHGPANDPRVFHVVWSRLVADQMQMKDSAADSHWNVGDHCAEYTVVVDAQYGDSRPLLAPSSSTSTIDLHDDSVPIQVRLQAAWYERLKHRISAAQADLAIKSTAGAGEAGTALHSPGVRGRRASLSHGRSRRKSLVGDAFSIASSMRAISSPPVHLDGGGNGAEALNSGRIIASLAAPARQAAKILSMYQAPVTAVADGRLTARSFESYDLTNDQQIEDAILCLLSDKRKQLWAQARVLESRFRDDLNIEVARRWQSWMAMPREYSRDVTEPFVFRKRDLRRGLGFKRSDLSVGVGQVPHTRIPGELVGAAASARPTPAGNESVAASATGVPEATANATEAAVSSAASASDDASVSASAMRERTSSVGSASIAGRLGRSRTLSNAGSVDTDVFSASTRGDRIKGHLKSLVRQPSAALAQAVLEETGRGALEAGTKAAHRFAEGLDKGVKGMMSVGDRMKAEMQAAVSLAPLPDPDPKDYQARLREQYADVLGAEGKKAASKDTAVGKSKGGSHRRASLSGQHGLLAPVAEEGTAGGIGDDGVAGDDEQAEEEEEEMIQTAFGVSHALPNMRTISSSVQTGMASITGSRTMGQPGISGYWQYFASVSSAPIMGADGDEVSFDVSAPTSKGGQQQQQQTDRSDGGGGGGAAGDDNGAAQVSSSHTGETPAQEDNIPAAGVAPLTAQQQQPGASQRPGKPPGRPPNHRFAGRPVA